MFMLITLFVELSFTNSFLGVKLANKPQLLSLDNEKALNSGKMVRDCPLTASLTPHYICSLNVSKSQPVSLVLFTTMTYRKWKLLAYNRTIHLWPLLGPEVKPLLFLAPTNDSRSTDYSEKLDQLATRACARGWDVLIAPHCNMYNYPVLASMFRLAQEIVNSTWYGYANADILFTDTILSNLHFLEEQNATPVDLVVGRRTNVVVSCRA